MDQGPALNQGLLPNQAMTPAAATGAPASTTHHHPPAAAPVVIIMQAPVDSGHASYTKEHYRRTFSEKYAMALSVFCIVMGFLSIVFQVVLICTNTYYGDLSQGIWCGFWYILAGGFGVAAAKKPSPCTVIALMVLAIFAACMTVPYVVISGIGLGDHHRRFSENLLKGFSATMLVMGLLAGIASVILSAMTCRTACCAKSKSRGAVVYNPAAAAAAIPQSAVQTSIPLGDIAQAINTAAAYQPTQQPQTVTPPPDYAELGKQTQKESAQLNTTQDDDGDTDYKRFF